MSKGNFMKSYEESDNWLAGGSSGSASFKGTGNETWTLKKAVWTGWEGCCVTLLLWNYNQSISQTFHQDIKDICQLVEKVYNMSLFKYSNHRHKYHSNIGLLIIYFNSFFFLGNNNCEQHTKRKKKEFVHQEPPWKFFLHHHELRSCYPWKEAPFHNQHLQA